MAHFGVWKKNGTIAYRLNLPPDSKLHVVFHVSKLKLGTEVHCQPTLPPLAEDGSFQPYPEAILARRLVKCGNVADLEVLIQWHGAPK